MIKPVLYEVNIHNIKNRVKFRINQIKTHPTVLKLRQRVHNQIQKRKPGLKKHYNEYMKSLHNMIGDA